MALNTQTRRTILTSTIFVLVTAAVFPFSVVARQTEYAGSAFISVIPTLKNAFEKITPYANLGNFLSRHPLPRIKIAIDTPDETPLLPDLYDFTQRVQNGEPKTLRGVYVNGLFALPVVQQVGDDAGYVSSQDGMLTQFSLADQLGNVGLLAHNYLSGKLFFLLEQGQPVALVYGDGRLEYFRVSEIQQYQALSPYSTFSDFIDLNTKETLNASELFTRIYKGKRHITFQTCIASDGISSWGRIFVIAIPEEELQTQ